MDVWRKRYFSYVFPFSEVCEGSVQGLLIRVVPGEFVGVRIKAFPFPVLDVRMGTPQPCAQGKELVPHRERVRRRETGRK